MSTLQPAPTPTSLALAGGEPVIFHCHHYNVVLQQSIEDAGAGAGVDAPALLTDAAAAVAHAQLAGRLEGPLPARLEAAASVFRRAGFGLVDVQGLGPAGGVARLPSSHYALGFRAREVARTTPGCFFAAGWLEGALAAALDRPPGAFTAVETACAAAGAPACEVRLTPAAAPRPLVASPGLGAAGDALPPRATPVATPVDEAKILAALATLPLEGNEEGVIQAFGLYLTRHYANYYNAISYELERRVDPSLRASVRDLLVEAGHVCAFNTFGGIMESPEWDALVRPMCRDKADWVSGIVACVNAFGWGRWTVTELVPDARLRVVIDAGYESNYHLARWGVVDAPVCYLAQGGVAGIMNLLWTADVTARPELTLEHYDRLFSRPDGFRATEVRCRAKGDDACELVAERPGS